MFDPERLLGQMLGNALGGALGGSRGRKKGRSAFSTGSLGGKAQLGIGLLGVAVAAWEHYSQKGGTAPSPVPGQAAPTAAMPLPSPSVPPPPPPGTPPPPPQTAARTRAMPLLDERQQSVVLLIRTMIAAANADGHIDAQERERILAHARDGGLDADTLAFLDAELARPQSLDQVIANARPDLAAETYAAAALAITIDTEAERLWLDRLAAALKLDPARRAELDARIAG